MARKKVAATLDDIHGQLDGTGLLPPILTGCPTWAPPGHGCRLECVQEIQAPGRRRATRQDKEAYLATLARDLEEQAEARRKARAERPAPQPEPERPAPRGERPETSEQYLARVLREPGPRPLPADTPSRLYDPEGADAPLPTMRPLRPRDY